MIPHTNTIAMPTMSAAEAWNNSSMINMINPIAITIRSRITEMSGAWLNRLSAHRDRNSGQWFFFIIRARKKGAMTIMVIIKPIILPHKLPAKSVANGTTICKHKIVIAIDKTE